MTFDTGQDISGVVRLSTESVPTFGVLLETAEETGAQLLTSHTAYATG